MSSTYSTELSVPSLEELQLREIDVLEAIEAEAYLDYLNSERYERACIQMHCQFWQAIDAIEGIQRVPIQPWELAVSARITRYC